MNKSNFSMSLEKQTSQQIQLLQWVVRVEFKYGSILCIPIIVMHLLGMDCPRNFSLQVFSLLPIEKKKRETFLIIYLGKKQVSCYQQFLELLVEQLVQHFDSIYYLAFDIDSFFAYSLAIQLPIAITSSVSTDSTVGGIQKCFRTNQPILLFEKKKTNKKENYISSKSYERSCFQRLGREAKEKEKPT